MWFAFAILFLCTAAFAAPQDARDHYENVGLEVDVCSLPYDKGNGTEFSRRFYYDAKRGTCHVFTFRGSGGNNNNFVTKDDCLNACAKDPCKITEPYVLRQTCEFYDNRTSTCSSGNFCFTTQSPERGVCCPANNRFDVCSLPLDEGIAGARGSSQRFYYSAAENACKEFTFHGTGGNANHFFLSSACEEKCVQKAFCNIGVPFGSQIGPQQCDEETACPDGYFCNDVDMCCPLTPRQLSNPQSLEPSASAAALPMLYVVLIISLLIC